MTSPPPPYRVRAAASPEDARVRRQGSLAIWLDIQRSVDLPHFVDSACFILTRRDGDLLSDTQQNIIVGALLHVSGETVRQWRRGMARPPYDRLLGLIVRASRAAGGEFELLAEIYGPARAEEMWGAE